MWFKNLSLLRFTEAFQLSAEELHERLNAGRFQACGSLQPMSYGFVPPVGGDDAPLVHAANGCFMVCAQKEEKILPTAVVNEVLAEKIAEIEERKGSPLRKKERDALRDEVIHDLLPKAFSFSRRVYAYIDSQGGWLVVDAASTKKTEELASWLRRCLESLPVAPPVLAARPATEMTRWLSDGSVPLGFSMENECELRASDEEGAVVRCKNQDLTAPEIHHHLEAGKEVVKIALNWQDRLSFVLDDALNVRRLRFLDLIQDQADEVEAHDAAERFDVDFAIMSLELAEFLPRLLELFNGESSPKISTT